MDNYDLTEQEEAEYIQHKKVVKRNARVFREYERELEEKNDELVRNQ